MQDEDPEDANEKMNAENEEEAAVLARISDVVHSCFEVNLILNMNCEKDKSIMSSMVRQTRANLLVRFFFAAISYCSL